MLPKSSGSKTDSSLHQDCFTAVRSAVAILATAAAIVVTAATAAAATVTMGGLQRQCLDLFAPLLQRMQKVSGSVTVLARLPVVRLSLASAVSACAVH